ncbi:unnamed protein product, partial [Bubo scandiacus]
MTQLATVQEKLKKAAAQRRDGRRAVLQNKHDPTVRRRSRQVGAALGDAVLGLMPLPSREVGELSQANWLLQEVTSRSLPRRWKEKVAGRRRQLGCYHGFPGWEGRCPGPADGLAARSSPGRMRIQDHEHLWGKAPFCSTTAPAGSATMPQWHRAVSPSSPTLHTSSWRVHCSGVGKPCHIPSLNEDSRACLGHPPPPAACSPGDFAECHL